MTFSRVYLPLCVLTGFLSGIFALPTGAPSTACVSMYPQHPGPNGPASAQPGLVVPFQIQVAPAQDGTRAYKITVVRNPNYPSQPNLLGFFLQVRDPNAETPLGEWKNLPGYARVGDCQGSNTVTHVANTPKPIDQGGLELTWEPTNLPPNTKNLQILGTFVQSMQTFWVKVPSQIFTVTPEDSPAPTAPVIVNTNNAGPVAVTSVFGTTEIPLLSVNHNNVDATNDRRAGFGNSAVAAVANPGAQQPGFRLNSGGEKTTALAGCFTLLVGLVMMVL